MGAPRFRLLLFALLSMLGFGLVIVPVGPAASQAAPKDAAPPAAGQEVGVDLVLFHANPAQVEITTGTTVTWVNKEPFDYPLFSGRHELQADDGSFASPSMAPGTRWSHRFLLPGTYRYHCEHHSDLAGTIVVTGPPIVENLEKEIGITENNPDDPKSWGFRPDDLVVTTGTTVVWRNNGTHAHTVTSNDNAFGSTDIAPGATFRFTFDHPGAFGYHCTPHPWMHAAIRVVLPGGTPPPPPPPPPPPAPAVHHPRDAAPAAGAGPVRHDVDLVEVNPADPTGWMFDPANLELHSGDTVVWHNTGSQKHSITSDDGTFDSGLIPPGGTWSRRFPTAVAVGYHCTPHPWMKGVIRVSEPGQAPPALAASTTRTAAAMTMAAAPAGVPRAGSGPVTVPVNIVEPNLADAMGWGFAPKDVDVKAGDTIVWHNTGTLQHSITADTFDAGLVDPGHTFSRRFDTPGVYTYHCTPHPWMKGVVRVASAEDGSVPAVPAGLEQGPPGGGGGTQASTPDVPAGLARALPLRNFPSPVEQRTALKLGLALLVSAAVIGLTALGAVRSPAPAAD